MTIVKVHLLRHGEVYNPDKVLYGRLPGFGLSKLGHEMAQMAYDNFLKDQDISYIASSPLERTRETAAPTAQGFDLGVTLDDRLIEAENHLQGLQVSKELFKKPKYWKYLRNPFAPSWGENYNHIAARMLAAIDDAAHKTHGHDALLVSHQLPIWITRLEAEGKRKFHNPTQRECSLASVTSLTYNTKSGVIEKVEYHEPAKSLLAQATTIPGA
ncbi:MAG: histidine phosphatase family protein [Micrococcaceae bacterium]